MEILIVNGQSIVQVEFANLGRMSTNNEKLYKEIKHNVKKVVRSTVIVSKNSGLSTEVKMVVHDYFLLGGDS